MKHAVKVCEKNAAESIKGCAEDFLSEPQDARGLPLSWCEEEERRYENRPTCCTAIYDYDSVPDMVISNGHDDWPLRIWEAVLRA